MLHWHCMSLKFPSGPAVVTITNSPVGALATSTSCAKGHHGLCFLIGTRGACAWWRNCVNHTAVQEVRPDATVIVHPGSPHVPATVHLMHATTPTGHVEAIKRRRETDRVSVHGSQPQSLAPLTAPPLIASALARLCLTPTIQAAIQIIAAGPRDASGIGTHVASVRRRGDPNIVQMTKALTNQGRVVGKTFVESREATTKRTPIVVVHAKIATCIGGVSHAQELRPLCIDTNVVDVCIVEQNRHCRVRCDKMDDAYQLQSHGSRRQGLVVHKPRKTTPKQRSLSQLEPRNSYGRMPRSIPRSIGWSIPSMAWTIRWSIPWSTGSP